MSAPKKSDKIALSKTLSWLLRHAATREGLPISPDGFISVEHVLNHPSLKGKYTVKDVQDVVASNDKQRFCLRHSHSGETLEIRANQGHSLKEVHDLELVPVLNANSVGDVVHGTYFKCLDAIKAQGLSRMNRNHIHFAPGIPSRNIISGMRHNAQVYIFIDIAKAIEDGIKFYKSANEVILSPGNAQGYLEPKYFLKVCRTDGSAT